MPEGDTLHRAAAAMGPLLVGRPLVAVYDRGLLRRRLAGVPVTGVRAEGKHLIIDLSAEATIHVHLGMHGRWWKLRPDEAARYQRSAALVLVLRDVAVVVVRAPVIEFLRPAFVHAHPVLSRLGPDLLSPDPVDFDAILRRARASDTARTVAELLLDQRVAGGIGNIYKCEALFAERVHPFAPVAALDDRTLLALYRRAQAQLASNLGPGMRTTTVDRTRGARPRAGVGRYHVYRRAGRPCHVCATPIAVRRVGDANRSTYYCPTCQPATHPPPHDDDATQTP